MANANNSLTVGKIRGSIGKELVFREWDGDTIVAKSPKKRKGEPTDAQVQITNKFQLASQYAIGIMEGNNDPLIQAYTAAIKKKQNLYSRIMEDYLKAPQVISINKRDYTGAIGSKINITALDDFRVVRVIAEIYAANGTLLETGDAVMDENKVGWVYTATQNNNLLAGTKIKAIAIDIPKNEGTLEITL
jgi:hypothetical protein